jgi:hypothetical protein
MGMEVRSRAMQDSIEDAVYAVGDAFVSSSLGTAELMVAALVALVFAFSAVRTLAKSRDGWHIRHKQH